MVKLNNDSAVEDDDVGASIYREVQLRKAKAAATAAESKKTSTASISIIELQLGSGML